MPTYDYIIIGAGASGLLLAHTMANDTFFKDKSILLLDRSEKKSNDRTWCFWEKGMDRLMTSCIKNGPKFILPVRV